jgi:putative addiction module CopG family antidote
MDLVIKPDLEQYIRDKVRTGEYPDADAVVNQAVAFLKDQEEKKQWLREELAKGVESLRVHGPVDFDLKTFLAERRREYDEKQKGLAHGGPR